MDLSTVLIEQLDTILDPSGPDADGLGASASALVETLSGAIPSFSGLDLRLRYAGHPVTLTAFAPPTRGLIATSLGWRWDGLPEAEPARLIFYAGRAGAFVDLAADLEYALAQGRRARSVDAAIELDCDLPPRTTESGLTGLAELSLLNRACGVLIGRGVEPRAAMEALISQAGAAGLDRYSYARQLLQPTDITGPQPDPGEPSPS